MRAYVVFDPTEDVSQLEFNCSIPISYFSIFFEISGDELLTSSKLTIERWSHKWLYNWDVIDGCV